MILLLNLLAFLYLFTVSSNASPCSCSTPRPHGGIATVARDSILADSSLPAGLDDQDIICEWKGYKTCCGPVAGNSRIRANHVSDNWPNKNIHFQYDDTGSDHSVKTCKAIATQSINKNVTCYYAGSSSSNPISGLSSIELAVTEPVTCSSSESVTLTDAQMDIVRENLHNYYINRVASYTIIDH